MADLDTREWLLTNGLGGFASGTVSDVRTRTYHGWLFAATSPPSGRTLLLSHLEASLEIGGEVVVAGTNFWGSGQIEPTGYELLRYFQINPVPKWVWGDKEWQLTRRMIMPSGLGENFLCPTGGIGEEASFSKTPNNQYCHRILVHYLYEGNDVGVLRLRLLIADRNFHHQQKETSDLLFSQILGERVICLQSINAGDFGTPWQLRWTRGEYQAEAVWYWNYGLPEETRRGLGDREDLYSPGYLNVVLQPGDTVTLEAKVGFLINDHTPLNYETFSKAVEAEESRLNQIFGWSMSKGTEKGLEENLVNNSNPTAYIPRDTLWQKILRASEQFIVYRASISGPSVIAGYHWFNDWGRDTLIALPGLTLVTGRFKLAKGLLETFGRYCRHGLIPNGFPDVDGEPSYNSIDAALWWIEALGLYLEATQDWDFLVAQYPVVQQIYKAFIGGTLYNIQVDSTDGLISWDARGVALTWMDALVEGKAVTPRRGKPVEVNALWFSALCWSAQWAKRLSEIQVGDSLKYLKQAQRYSQQAQQVKESLQKYWNSQLRYLYDSIEPDDRRNSQIRPNAVLALSLYHCGFSQSQGEQILELAASRLLTPYGLRSLEPSDPEYIGKYVGDSTQRDSAYHQGTVWSWLIGPFVRSWERFFPGKPLPFDWEPILNSFLNQACIGSISEIFDGDPPHNPRGAVAQAWSVAEIIRHFPK
ncbi:MAG: amylo-alpha-1,6-glucosidase [Mastigocoleus sp. MO_167.B18]|uniref:amylo-alpha-1,6-glucosidase n=1 Tax=Mastigocoleus sp. MO_188.B34 TaxID=3036635 RepID=UPI00260D9D42|nr:amylo-alpha-1,6-glucosidase [Mastigocoleus sp. MO_188.B34]MDJ0694944.1 amylo-alpha-1,6-glucosidase [Mastigocoleus sp. MO_188.B34]MDJ0773552.1 amylo-alpha-1,6-glucosidase [Mastigocoleus sp. MO_167.B18]